MGERKVLNKYYPPDFDPTLIPRARRPKNEQYKVRMMVPMSIRCLTCGEFIYKGKKFNARKETVQGEEYLGIKIFRFYVKCTRCSSEITIKTDPKNSDYVCEMGATRNFEGWKEGEKMMEQFRKQREEEEMGNAMKALENKTLDNKMEMDILDGLDEIRSLNAKASKVDPMQILEHIQNQDKVTEETNEDPEEEETLRLLKVAQVAPQIRRLPDEEQPADLTLRPVPRKSNSSTQIRPKSDILSRSTSDSQLNKEKSQEPGVLGTSEKRASDGFKVPLPRLPKKVKPQETAVVTIPSQDGKKHVVSLKFQPKFRKTALVKKSPLDQLLNY